MANDEVRHAEGGPAKDIRGVVKTVRRANEDSVWSTGTMRLDGTKQTITFAGNVFVKEGDRVTLHGTWQDDPKWGRQFRVEYGLVELPIDAAGLRELLASDERFPGIGPAKAKAIVEALPGLGGDFGKVLDDPAKRAELCRLAKVSPDALENVRKHWATNVEQNEAKTKLLGMGFTAKEANSILRVIPDPKEAVEVARTDPWSLWERTEGIGFKRADEIARASKLDEKDRRRIDAGIRWVVNEELNDGHTWTDIPYLVGRAGTALDIRERDIIESRLQALSGPGGRLVKVEIEMERQDHPGRPTEKKLVIASVSAARCESNVAERICGGKDERNAHFRDGEFTETLIKELEPRANDDQARAILAATRFKNLVVTGPAGTGKTFLVAAVSRLYRRRGKRVLIAAPTGKAAKRLFQVLREQGLDGEPMTIHKLLEYDPRRKGGEWGRGRARRLEADLVIVDEGSMADILLLSRLLDAMDPRTALIFAGDHNQLPSVGPGAILRDLVSKGTCQVARLEIVVRQAGVLCTNSLEILRGIVRPTSEPSPAGEYEWFIDGGHNDEVAARDAVLAHYGAFLDNLGETPQTLQEVQVISPQKEGMLGINALNVAIQRMAQRRVMKFDVPDATKGRGGTPGSEFFVGDKVICTQNDYDLDLMNGDQGVVEELGPAGVRIKTPFRDEPVLVPNDKKKNLSLAYAITTHRGQGSQWDHVIAVIHGSAPKPLKHRGILYTAATRSSKSLVIVGNRAGIDEFARETREERRRTFLAHYGRFSMPHSVFAAEPPKERPLPPEALRPEAPRPAPEPMSTAPKTAQRPPVQKPAAAPRPARQSRWVPETQGEDDEDDDG